MQPLDVGPGREDEELLPETALADVARVSCPCCGAATEVVVDAGGGGLQEYVEDCEICCRPWIVRVTIDADGIADVSLSTLDDGGW